MKTPDSVLSDEEKCRAEFDVLINKTWERGVCQLRKRHKGNHDCTIASKLPDSPEAEPNAGQGGGSTK